MNLVLGSIRVDTTLRINLYSPEIMQLHLNKVPVAIVGSVLALAGQRTKRNMKKIFLRQFPDFWQEL